MKMKIVFKSKKSKKVYKLDISRERDKEVAKIVLEIEAKKRNLNKLCKHIDFEVTDKWKLHKIVIDGDRLTLNEALKVIGSGERYSGSLKEYWDHFKSKETDNLNDNDVAWKVSKRNKE